MTIERCLQIRYLILPIQRVTLVPAAIRLTHRPRFQLTQSALGLWPSNWSRRQRWRRIVTSLMSHLVWFSSNDARFDPFEVEVLQTNSTCSGRGSTCCSWSASRFGTLRWPSGKWSWLRPCSGNKFELAWPEVHLSSIHFRSRLQENSDISGLSLHYGSFHRRRFAWIFHLQNMSSQVGKLRQSIGPRWGTFRSAIRRRPRCGTPVADFTNILRAVFMPTFFAQKKNKAKLQVQAALVIRGFIICSFD